MDNATFQKIKDIILKNADIAVIVGKNPNLDQMAAGLGLYLALKQMGKNVSIACPTDPIVAISSLVGINQVQKAISGEGGDLTVTFPYKEGEIEKVSYTLDNGQLNIVVKAGEKGLSFQQKEVLFKRGGKMPTLIFFVGIPRMSDVSEIYSLNPSQSASIVNIDNSPENEKYGDISVADSKWSSVSEQVADFVTLLEPQIELDNDTAQNLLDGIYFATNDFKNEKTSYLAFEVAGILMKKGAKRQKSQATVGASKNQIGESPTSSVFFPQSVMPSQQTPIVQQAVNQNAVTQPQSFQPVRAQQSQSAPQQQSPVQNQVVQQPSTAWQAPTQKQQAAPVQTPPDWLTPKVYKGSSVL